MEKLWYVVNTYSGHEESVKEKLEMRTESMGMQDHIFRVIIPETTEIEIKDGVKKEKKKKMFPMNLNLWKACGCALYSGRETRNFPLPPRFSFPITSLWPMPRRTRPISGMWCWII